MITFYLAKPRKERSAIFISIVFKGKQYRRTTKESTLVKYWNLQKHRVRVCRENREANRTNEILEQWQEAASKSLVKFKRLHDAPTPHDLFDEVDRLFYSGYDSFSLSPMKEVSGRYGSMLFYRLSEPIYRTVRTSPFGDYSQALPYRME